MAMMIKSTQDMTMPTGRSLSREINGVFGAGDVRTSYGWFSPVVKYVFSKK
jgi:hypothetical protein